MSTISRLCSFQGAHIVITGASSPCSMHLTTLLLESGAKLSLIDQRISESLTAFSSVPEVSILQLDLASSQDFVAYQDHVSSSTIAPSGLVNLAAITGISLRNSHDDSWSGEWAPVLKTNAQLPLDLIQHFSETCDKQSHNLSIVNVSSIYSMLGPRWSNYIETPYVSPAPYHASKAALNQITRWAATKLGPKNIRINSISSGGIYRDHLDVFVDRYSANVPLGRMASDMEIASSIFFLLSPLSSYITGHNLVVDGGLSIHS